jgi:hypothetical protein
LAEDDDAYPLPPLYEAANTFTPATNEEVTQVAILELTVTAEQPVILVPPDVKLTVPAPPEPTVAVKVSVLPRVDWVSGDTESEVVVADPETTATRGVDLILYKVLALEYA